jgi:hypothetical protein
MLNPADHSPKSRAFEHGEFYNLRMLLPDRDFLCQEPDGTIRYDGSSPEALLPGSFNPLHAGHEQLAEVGARSLGREVHYELSVVNVDKPDLEEGEIARRLTQFRGKGPIWVTRAKTFDRKSLLFPGAVFIVGADTAARIVSPRYYAGSAKTRDERLAVIRDRGCRFLVAGRQELGRFLTLGEIEIPTGFHDLFEAIPETAFRLDLSSTRLRGAGYSRF